MTNPKDDHWLVRPASIRLLWLIFIAILLLTVGVQFLTGTDGHFGIDGWYAFGAVYGFLSCLIMVLAAKGLGFVLKRPDDYYDKDAGDD
ncbi:hypothetical protein [Pelagibius marinus]|uniref:hypothetical protein n=1 Tax=Pelagibius marinus TaxID=2762760 RepID=UPI0018731581|nr:hypothetical protein [Pelagibius marinus]